MNRYNKKALGYTEKIRKISTPKKIRRKFEQPAATAVTRMLWRQARIVFGSLVAALGFSLFQVPFRVGGCLQDPHGHHRYG